MLFAPNAQFVCNLTLNLNKAHSILRLSKVTLGITLVRVCVRVCIIIIILYDLFLPCSGSIERLVKAQVTLHVGEVRGSL